MPPSTPSSSLFARWGISVHDHRWPIIAAWIVATVVLNLVAPDWSTVARDGDLEQLPADTMLIQGERLSRQAFPGDTSRSQLVLVFARRKLPLTVQDREFALHLANELVASGQLDIVDVWNEKTPVVGEALRSASGHSQRIVMRLKNEFMATENIRMLASVERILSSASRNTPAGLQVGVSGSAAIGGDMLSAAAASVQNTHFTTVLLVAVALMLIYRSPFLVVIPLATITLSASASIDLLALLADFTERHPGIPSIRVFTTTKIFVIVLLFGAGTDFCLFLTARFREHRGAGEDLRASLASALKGVGSALVASAFTTIVGLATMAFAEFGKFAYSGPSIAISLGITLLACLTLAPALLATRLGNLISSERSDKSFWRGRWARIADVVLARPGMILAMSALVALPFAWLGWDVPVTYDLFSELPPHRPSRHGTEMLRNYFPPGEIGPVVILAESHDGLLDSVDGQLRIAELAKPLDDLPGVAQVRSLYQPLGAPPGSVSLFSSSGIMALATKESPLTKAVFVSETGKFAGRVTRLFLILADQPFSREAVRTLNEVEATLTTVRNDRQSPWNGARFALTGPTVGIRDLETVTLADRVRIEVLVVLAVFAVLLLLLRSPVISCFLMVSVVLSYAVTVGLTWLTFKYVHGSEFLGLDWKVPLFLFVLLVAVGQDYNIYLVTRVHEEQRRYGPCEGLRKAIIETGGIITSCGVIMAGTFVSMTTGELNGIVELGFALTLGILLDTFVVRTILVPAFLALLSPPKPAKQGAQAEK